VQHHTAIEMGKAFVNVVGGDFQHVFANGHGEVATPDDEMSGARFMRPWAQ
jgi:hypothetical protein